MMKIKRITMKTKEERSFKMKKIILTIGLFLSPLLSEGMFTDDGFPQRPHNQQVKRKAISSEGSYQTYHTKIREGKANIDIYVHLRALKVHSMSEEQIFAVIKITRKYKRETSTKVGLFRLLPAEGGQYHWSLLFTQNGTLESSKDIFYTSVSASTNRGKRQLQLLETNLSCDLKVPNKIVLQQVVSSRKEVWKPFPFNAFIQKNSKKEQIGYIQEGQFYSGRALSQEGDFILQKMTPYIAILRPKVPSLFTASGWDVSLESESIALVFQNKSSWQDNKTILFIDNEDGNDNLCFKDAVPYDFYEQRN